MFLNRDGACQEFIFANLAPMSRKDSCQLAAANPLHERHGDGVNTQSMKAWSFACFLLKISQIHGTSMPNIKDFSEEKLIKRKVISRLEQLYDCTPEETFLLVAEGDILELPLDVAACIPISTQDLSQEDRSRARYGKVLKHRIDDRLYFECLCLPTFNDQAPLDSRLYWLTTCLDNVFEQCVEEGISRIAIPFRFNNNIEGDESNWTRYVESMENWAQEHRNQCQLIVVARSFAECNS